MIRAHKIRLHPTSEQANYFARARPERAATRENWALSEWDRQYQAGEKPTAFKRKHAVQRDQAGALPPFRGKSRRTLLTSPFLIWARRLRLSSRKRPAAHASKARSEANPASISPMISSSWVIIASGFPSSAGSTWPRSCVLQAR